MLKIDMQGVAINIGNGHTETGEKSCTLNFIDQQSGIVVSCTIVGDGIQNMIRAMQAGAGGIEIARQLPGINGPGPAGGPGST